MDGFVELYCNSSWDEITCWPDTEPNQTVYLQCANYINGFYVNSEYLTCTLDRSWTGITLLCQHMLKYRLCTFDQIWDYQYILNEYPLILLMYLFVVCIHLFLSFSFSSK